MGGVGGITYAGGNVSVTTSEGKAEPSASGRLIWPPSGLDLVTPAAQRGRRRLQLPPKTQATASEAGRSAAPQRGGTHLWAQSGGAFRSRTAQQQTRLFLQLPGEVLILGNWNFIFSFFSTKTIKEEKTDPDVQK